MAASEALESLRKAHTVARAVRELSQPEVDEFARRVADEFVQDVSSVWWWEGLKRVSWSRNYEGAEIFELLEELVPGHEEVVLLVTNEHPKPEAAFAGPFAEIVELIKSSLIFEFAIVSPSVDWAMFDTHANSLICVGEPPGPVECRPAEPEPNDE